MMQMLVNKMCLRGCNANSTYMLIQSLKCFILFKVLTDLFLRKTCSVCCPGCFDTGGCSGK